MKFCNGLVLDETFTWIRKDFFVRNGVFLWDGQPGELETDLGGNLVIPGLIDLHFHGCNGVDFCNTDLEGIKKMAAYMAQQGITSMAPASMSLPGESLKRIYQTAADFHKWQEKSSNKDKGYAKLVGINMEGPFLSVEKKGAQDVRYLMEPNLELVEDLWQASEGLLKIVCIAPELPGAEELIRKVSLKSIVSIGHTSAGYHQAACAIRAGASQVTHLFNGMPPFFHREPGVIGAAAEAKAVRAELICDGIHVHESAVRAAFAMFGSERVILISDALSPCGMDGNIEGRTFFCGEQEVFVRNGTAMLHNGCLAGSVTNLYECLKKAIGFGIKMEDAIRAATLSPAQALGISRKTGSLKAGKRADFLVICPQDMTIQNVYMDGVRQRAKGRR